MTSILKDETARNAIAGGIAGLVAAVITCPLDMVKIRLQNKSTAVSSAKVFMDIWHANGLIGLYRGVGPTATGYLPTWMIYFSVYDWAKKHYRNDFDDPLFSNILAALHAGICSTAITNPLWVARTRIMTQSLAQESNTSVFYYKGTFDALKTIYRTEGFKALYKGLGPSLLGVSHVAIQFPFYEYLKSLKSIEEHNWVHILFASSISKTFASSVTYPHEVIRTRLQTQMLITKGLSYDELLKSKFGTGSQLGFIPVRPNNAGQPVTQSKYVGILQSAKIILREEGWRGFYKGFSINLIRTVPASGLTILTYEVLSEYFRHLSSV